jgi:hypothetical protein
MTAATAEVFRQAAGVPEWPFTVADRVGHRDIARDVLASVLRLRAGLPIGQLSLRSHALLVIAADDGPPDVWDRRDFGDLLDDPGAGYWLDVPPSPFIAPLRLRPPVHDATPQEPADSICALGWCQHHGHRDGVEHWEHRSGSTHVAGLGWWRLAPDRLLQRAATVGAYRTGEEGDRFDRTGPVRYIGSRLALMHHRARLTRSMVGAVATMSAPPRSGKTATAIGYAALVIDQGTGGGSVRHHGRAGVVSVSANDRLARRRARDLRRLVGAPFIDGQVPRDSSAVDSFQMVGGGVVTSSGANGSVLGSDIGTGAIILDDPHGAADAARSDVQSETVYADVWRSQMMTRIGPGSGATGLVAATRLAPTDVVGRMYDEPDADRRYLNLTIPALAVGPDQADDPLCRVVGESGNTRASTAIYIEMRDGMSARQWAGEYCQDPTGAAATGVLPRDRWPTISDLDPAIDLRTCVAVGFDLAATSGHGDQTAAVALGLTVDDELPVAVLDVAATRVDAADLIGWCGRVLSDVVSRFGSYADVVACVEQQPGAAGKVMAETIRAQLETIAKVVMMPATGSKLARVGVAAAWQNSASIGIVDTIDHETRALFVNQCDAFTGRPGGTDDLVDAFAYAAIYLRDAPSKHRTLRRRVTR